MIKQMQSKKMYGNWNYIYEYKLTYMVGDKLHDEWCPCHIIIDTCFHLIPKGKCHVRNRYGNPDIVPINSVRKMSKEYYLKTRSKYIERCGDVFRVWRFGFHENIEDDLKLYEKSNDLEEFKNRLKEIE